VDVKLFLAGYFVAQAWVLILCPRVFFISKDRVFTYEHLRNRLTPLAFWLGFSRAFMRYG